MVRNSRPPSPSRIKTRKTFSFPHKISLTESFSSSSSLLDETVDVLSFSLKKKTIHSPVTRRLPLSVSCPVLEKEP